MRVRPWTNPSMDILAHALWAGVGTTLASRRIPISRPAAVAIVGLAVLPDIIHLLPLLTWVIAGDGTMAILQAYVLAGPGQEPPLPPMVALLSHHLHCIMHSAVVAGLATLLLWLPQHRFWIPLAGWWSHIVIDIFTHSADFYPVPVLYPFTERGFDGLAWNEPWFLMLNYTALALCILGLLRTRRRQ
jgi:LexA-binding, inner membrane-associated putative hydrolase